MFSLSVKRNNNRIVVQMQMTLLDRLENNEMHKNLLFCIGQLAPTTTKLKKEIKFYIILSLYLFFTIIPGSCLAKYPLFLLVIFKDCYVQVEFYREGGDNELFIILVSKVL